MKNVFMAIGLAGVMLCGPVSASGVAREPTLVQLVADKAEKHNVPLTLARAIIQKESGFNPRVISQGNYGLGQIQCPTARELGFAGKCSGLLDPETNLEYSMRYLRQALNKSKGDWCHAATLYNQGLYSGARRGAYCRSVLRLTK